MSATWHCDRCPMPTIFASPFRRKTARATRAVENKLIDQQMRKYFDKLSINRQHRTSRVVVQQPSTAASGKQLTAATQHQAYNNSQLLTKSRRVPFAKIRPQALPILVQHKKNSSYLSLSLSTAFGVCGSFPDLCLITTREIPINCRHRFAIFSSNWPLWSSVRPT